MNPLVLAFQGFRGNGETFVRQRANAPIPHDEDRRDALRAAWSIIRDRIADGFR